jgi:23S rRNA (uracil1939-C5)-methyltransferase
MGSAPETQTCVIRIAAMTYGGDALGRVVDQASGNSGKAIFVRGAIAGELVRAEIVEERGTYARARVVEVLEPAPERVQPRCPHFGFESDSCGGCAWQHIDYPAQLRFKQDIVREQFRRIGRIPDAPVHETLPSPKMWAYRNHAQFSVAANGQLGFQAARSNRVLPIEVCHVIEADLLDWLRTGLRASPGVERLDARSFDLQSPIMVKGLPFRVSAESFFQVNTSLIETLVDQTIARLDLRGGEAVVDGYCGVGLFSRFLSPVAGRVIGIELSRSAAADARVNLAACSNVEVREGLVEDVLPRLVEPIDAAVLDPPRAGCGPAVIRSVIDHKIERLVYVSCDPATLARDARQLTDGGYRLLDAQPLDMFPHTYHIETLSTWMRVGLSPGANKIVGPS